jgi:hypothetical protein
LVQSSTICTNGTLFGAFKANAAAVAITKVGIMFDGALPVQKTPRHFKPRLVVN